MRVKTLSVSEGKRLGIEDLPNFSVTGSIRGMKKKYYGEDALLIRCGGYIYYVGRNLCPSSYGRELYYVSVKSPPTLPGHRGNEKIQKNLM